jgi:integrase
MRGSIVERSETSWSLVIDQGRNQEGKRVQKWIRFDLAPNLSTRENRKRAHAKLAELLDSSNKGTLIDPSRLTLIDWLRSWHEKNVVPHRRPETSRVYRSMIDKHVAPYPIAAMLVQKVRTSDLEKLYASVKLKPASITVLHAIIGRALKIAVRDRLITTNPATAVEDRPRESKDAGRHARQNCWTAAEARQVLSTAKRISPQVSAFFATALDTGMRKSELLGLVWNDVNFEKGTITVSRQLEPRSQEVPSWAPTKTGTARVVTLGAETIARLKAHRKAQAEVKMANRKVYRDHGLAFAKEEPDLQTPTAALGQPVYGLARHTFEGVVKTAGVKKITVHGLRHTAATLLLSVGVPVQVVAQRLGHSTPTQTLEVYAHVTPDLQADAAVKLDALLA